MEAVTLTYEELRALDNERLLDLDYAAGVALEDLEGSFGAQVFEAKLPASVKDYELDQFRGMDRLTKSLQDGKITASEYGRQAHGLIHKNFEGAYRAGKGRALDDGDMEYIRRATDAELKYAVRFGNDVEAGRLVMPRVKRAGMYGRTVGAIAWHGNVEAQPDNVRIHWQLGVAEHCVDCLILAANSPYTKWDLPTTPGAGATKCLSNCQCTLRYVVGKQTREEREDAEDYGTRKGQTLSDLLAPGSVPRGLRLPTAPEAFYVDRLRNRINYWRRRVALAVSEDEVKHAAGMRMRFNDELIEFTEKNKIHEVPVWSVDDVLDGRHIGNRAVKDIFRHGLDGRSLSAVSQKRLLSMLNDYEDEFGTVFSDDAIIDGLLED